MNLHGVVAGAVGAVNPRVPVVVRVSTGSTTDDAGKRVPTYARPVTIRGQVQPLQSDDLRQLDALNIQGSQRKVFLDGRVDGLVRVENKGGDLLTIGSKTWLVTLVLEQWPDWVSAAVTLQDDPC